ncbi:hypothetical protein GMI69_02935 [Eggerthellaceae bacterium zg-887]|uniref:regulatory protein RecX n=1 Tax=Xiamenia xianingshaonis TaxID=2682776 RepID=UPI00140C0F9B|nr:regulatory protein RecX [Xiamenia xianingshaonis]NHM15630.1 hypothetical protein [Xiamenia xianingshaonis]
MDDKQAVLEQLRASMRAIERGGRAAGGTQTTQPARKQRAAGSSADAPEVTAGLEPLCLDDAGAADAVPSETYSGKGAGRRSGRAPGAGRSGGQEKGHDAAMSKIVRLVNHREHSTSSLKKRLLQASFDEAVAEAAIQRAVELGLVDDARYANILVGSRVAQGRGCQGIARELLDNHIDPETVSAFVEYRDEVAPQQEADQAVELLRKRPPRAKNQRDAAYRRLRQKGYDNATAIEAVNRWMDEAREEACRP